MCSFTGSCTFLHECLNIKKEVYLHLSTVVQHSLVTHPVGYHIDAYSRNGHGDVIENKIVLVNIQKSNKKCSTALGRGGPGPG